MNLNARDAPARHQSARSRHVANGPIEEPGSEEGRLRSPGRASHNLCSQSRLEGSWRSLNEASTESIGILRPTSAIGDGESEESRSEEERVLEETNELPRRASAFGQALVAQQTARSLQQTARSLHSGRAIAHGQRHWSAKQPTIARPNQCVSLCSCCWFFLDGGCAIAHPGTRTTQSTKGCQQVLRGRDS